MSEATQQAAEFLENVFDMTGLQLVKVKQAVSGVLDIEGQDAELLQAQTGELLEALQHLINQVFGRSLRAASGSFVMFTAFARRAKRSCRRWRISLRIAYARPALLYV